MKNKKNVGIYVHIPFCKQKCKYCDFKSYVGKENKIESYIKWLTYEIKEIGEGNRLDYENNFNKKLQLTSKSESTRHSSNPILMDESKQC